jgi:hypothetical protein
MPARVAVLVTSPVVVLALSFATILEDYPILQREPASAAVWGGGAASGAKVTLFYSTVNPWGGQ